MGKKAKERGATDEDRRNFHQAQRALSFLIRKDKEKKEKSAAYKQESSYRKEFFKFAKAACNGTLDKEEAGPTFSKEEADAHYKGTYSKAVHIDSAKLDWFPVVEPPTVPFDSSPITPKEVRDILKGKSPTTAPGAFYTASLPSCRPSITSWPPTTTRQTPPASPLKPGLVVW